MYPQLKVAGPVELADVPGFNTPQGLVFLVDAPLLWQQLVPAPQRSRFVKGLIPIANQQDNFGHHRYHGLLQLENAMNFIW